jgi:hypothetical protein
MTQVDENVSLLKRMALPVWEHIRSEHPEIALRLEYARRYRRLPRWAVPVTFNEKVRLKMIYDRRPLLRTLADKWNVRSYVAERLGGSEHLPRILARFDTAADIEQADIPAPFVMKASHGSGWIRIVRETTAETPRELARAAAQWLQNDYSRACRELCYRGLARYVLFEEFLGGDDGQVPHDFKFFCFHGVPRFVQIDEGRDTRHRQSFFDLALQKLPVRYMAENIDGAVDKPPHWDLMLDIATKLSRGTDFLRVDLYDLQDRVVFGELTNYPNTGDVPFDPPEYDEYFGSFWNYSRDYYRRPAGTMQAAS